MSKNKVETLAEFLARGGNVTKCPPAPASAPDIDLQETYLYLPHDMFNWDSYKPDIFRVEEDELA